MTVKLKRAILITLVIVLLCITSVMIAAFVQHYLEVCDTNDPVSVRHESKSIYPFLVSFCDIAVTCLCGICALAVVDFLISIAEKKYNMTTLGIAMALFVIFVIKLALSPAVIEFEWNLAQSNYVFDRLKILPWFYFAGQMAILLACTGLSISYVVTKRHFIKGQSKE